MRPKQYSCPKGCKLEPRKKELIEKADHTFTYGYDDFTYCPYCGSLMPYSLEKVKNFFDLFNIHPSLKRAVDLIYKSEFEAAAREAFVVVETMLREKSNLDLHGFDLATKALKFECDKKTGEVINKPLIAINALNTESEKNEQEGIRYMLMGFFQGPRNLFLHNHIDAGGSNVFSVLIEASFFLSLLDGHSMTKHGYWVRSEISLKEIYDNMPKRIDRMRFLRSVKKAQKRKTSSKPKT